MSTQPLISVVIPCYNAEQFVKQAIDSIINQTYTNLEIILIDDGSTDSTLKILNECSLNDSRISVYRNPENRKLIYTLSKGIELAAGEYIARMDADDTCTADRIQTQLNYLLDHPEVDACSTGYNVINFKGKILTTKFPKAINSATLKFISMFSTPINHGALLAKSNVMKENKYDKKYLHSEDYELFSRLLLNGYKMTNLNKSLYNYRKNLNSVSNVFEQIQIRTHIGISLRNLLQYFGEQPDEMIHKIMVHRLDFKPERVQVIEALNKLAIYKKEFLEKESCTAEERREIEDFMIEQQMDILIQSFKYSKPVDKLKLIPLLFNYRKIFYSKRGYNYLRSKIEKVEWL